MHGRGHHHHRHGEDPRITRTRAVVLEAAHRLLVEEGAEAVTPLRVAEITGVARTTIYRHWPDRDQLLLEAMAQDEPEHRASLIGDLHADLVSQLTHMARHLARGPAGPVLAAMIERAQRDPETAALQRERMADRMRPLRDILAAGIDRGDLPADLDVELAVARLAGPLFYRRIMTRQTLAEGFIATIVDAFLAAPTPRSPTAPPSR